MEIPLVDNWESLYKPGQARVYPLGQNDKKTTPSAKRPATDTSTKTTEVKVRRSARTTYIKSTKNTKKQSKPVEIEENNESKEDKDDLKENAKAENKDKEEEPNRPTCKESN